MSQSPAGLLPEVFLAAAAVIGLLIGSWLPKNRQGVVRAVAAGACIAGLVATAVTMAGPARLVFDGSFAVDGSTNAGRLVVLAATLAVICLSSDTVGGHPRETEFYVLLLLSATGTLTIIGANGLLILFAGYLLASVPGYALAGFANDSAGTEAALKYYLFGALLGVVMLAGITVLYGAGRSVGYAALHASLATAPHGAVAFGVVAVFAGLAFKSGAVPAHFWVPDVIDGATAPAAAFLATVPKIGGLAAAWRFVNMLPAHGVNWALLVAVLAAASMTLGNLAAFYQTNVKRLLGYSTISQVGYLLMAVAVAGRSSIAQQALWYYLAAYAATNLGAFAVVAALPTAATISDYRGLARRHPALAAVLVVCLLGLVGTPPTAVFVAKLDIFTATIDGGYTWLAVVAIANTVASLFYYLRWIAPLFVSKPDGAHPKVLPTPRPWAAASAYSLGTLAVAFGPTAQAILPLGARPLLR